MFKDYKTYPPKEISPSILWEYDITSPKWDWEKMAVRVVQRVIQYGNNDDYYAMLQKYGGFEGVREIVKEIPELSPRDLNWACFLFNLKKEETKCFTRKSSRAKLLNC